MKDRSPAILEQRWGRMEVEDGLVCKDVKVFPGGSREWDWNETGTRHVPGIQPADVEELIDNGARIVILTKGVLECLQVSEETIERLEAANVRYEILATGPAVGRYNELVRAGEAVGGLFHSTC